MSETFTPQALRESGGTITISAEENQAEKIVLTGNPVRANILNCELSQEEAKKQLGFEPQKKLLLIVGGSLGARTINESVANALDEILETGTIVTKQNYTADWLRICIANRAGDVIREIVFKDVMLKGSIEGMSDLDYSNNEAVNITVHFASDWWKETVA